jgi:hypothetical protein
VNSVTPAAGGQQYYQRIPDPAFPRLGAFICVFGLYLGFAGGLIALGYGLWPAIGGAATACVVAGEVARRIITASAAPDAGLLGSGAGLPELLSDIVQVMDRRGSQGAPGRGARKEI